MDPIFVRFHYRRLQNEWCVSKFISVSSYPWYLTNRRTIYGMIEMNRKQKPKSPITGNRKRISRHARIRMIHVVCGVMCGRMSRRRKRRSDSCDGISAVIVCHRVVVVCRYSESEQQNEGTRVCWLNGIGFPCSDPRVAWFNHKRDICLSCVVTDDIARCSKESSTRFDSFVKWVNMM